MLDKFRGGSAAFFRGNDDQEAYTEMMNSGLLILTRAYHANKGYDMPEPDDIGGRINGFKLDDPSGYGRH